MSQSVFGTIQRRLACPCADVDTHQSKSVDKFCVAQFLRFCVSFSFLFSRERNLAFVVASQGHVSLIVDQLGWQRCRPPLLHCCGVVVGSLVCRCETRKLSSSMLSSDRFTQTSQYSYSCRTLGDSHNDDYFSLFGDSINLWAQFGFLKMCFAPPDGQMCVSICFGPKLLGDFTHHFSPRGSCHVPPNHPRLATFNPVIYHPG